MRIIAIFAILFFTNSLYSQNLIINPGAEEIITNVGWTVISGNWVRDNQVAAHGGSAHFFAGGVCSTEPASGSEIIQDVNVSAYSTTIDAGAAQFTFSGWIRTYQGQDFSRIIVEYRDENNVVLSTYDTGLQKHNTWTQYSNVRIAPVNTRIIRIRLISKCDAPGADSDGYMDDLSLTMATITTPVSLIYFTATPHQDKVLLQWQTAHETQNDYFNVERSSDGSNWEVLGQLQGSGNSSLSLSYEFFDTNPNTGLQYYRLQQTDFSGQSTYSPIKSVHYKSADKFEIQIYNSDQITIRGSSIKKIDIYNSNGMLLKSLNNDSELESMSFPSIEIPTGFFIFSVHTEYEVINLKYLKK